MGRRSRLRAAHAQHRILGTATTVLDTVVGVHHTATVDKTWDAGANEKRLPAPISVSTARKVYAWYDSEQVDAGELPKTACKFPHHEVSADGTPGAANLAACRNGLARLSSANVPDADREGIRKHLQAHLDDGKSSTSDNQGGTLPRATVRSRAAEQLEAHGRQGKPGQTWYRIENLVQTPGVACIYLYGEIGMWGIEAADFIGELNQVNATGIELHINSMGGEVFEGIAILNALRSHRATVTTYVDGLAASIASVIAMAGEQIVMGRNTTMMVHEPHIIAIGDAEDLRATADMVEKQANNIAAIYAEKAGGTVESWRQVMRAETWYSADEAVAAGLADEVDTTGLPDTADTAVAAEMAASFDLSVFRYAGRDKAPAPKAVAEAPVEEPAAEPAPADPEPAAVEDEPVAEPATAVTAPEPAEEPVPPEPPVVTDTWAALVSGLLKPAPSTVDELLHALLQEGTPA